MRVLAVTPTYETTMVPAMRESMEAQQRAVAATGGEGEGLELDWVVLADNPWPAPDHRNVLHMYRMARAMALGERVVPGAKRRRHYDALWTVEHDIVLPANALQLLAAVGSDVVYGTYLMGWGGAFVPNVLEHVSDKNIGDPLALDPEKLKRARAAGVVRCSGVGWGCTLIRASALRAVEFPEAWPENPAFDIAGAQQWLRAGMVMHAHLGVACKHVRGGRVLDVASWAERVAYNGNAWLIGGQLVPMLGPAQPAAPLGRPWDDPTVQAGGREPRLLCVALRTMNALVNGESMRMRYGVKYELPTAVAQELARAGYVEVRSVVP